MRMPILISATLATAGCAPAAMDRAAAPVERPAASTTLRDAQGMDKGRVAIAEVGGKLRLTLDAQALPPGTLAFHVHSVGACDTPGFTTAGGHWNPAMKQHGRDNPMGAHAGDMPNLTVGADGRASAVAMLDGTLSQLLDADGASVIIHAQPDDYRTDPAGNAGARIACGVLSAG